MTLRNIFAKIRDVFRSRCVCNISLPVAYTSNKKSTPLAGYGGAEVTPKRNNFEGRRGTQSRLSKWPIARLPEFQNSWNPKRTTKNHFIEVALDP